MGILWIIPLAVLAASPEAAAGDNDEPVLREFCGEWGEAPFDRGLSWDCTGIESPSLASLEASIAADHSLQPPEGAHRLYTSQGSGPFSAWLVFEDRAIRYRAIYVDNRWKGVGITSFCSASEAECQAYATEAALMIPYALVFSLGPPPPVEPPVIYE